MYAIVQLPVKDGYKAKYYAGQSAGECIWSENPKHALGFDWAAATTRRNEFRASSGLTLAGRESIVLINLP